MFKDNQPERTLLRRLAACATALGLLLLPLVGWAQEAAAATEPAEPSFANLWGLGWGFALIGGFTIFAAVATITRRNPVSAAMWLVGTLGGSAVIYLLLHATFLAVMQVLVYAGAIMVLFVFVVMSVEHPEDQQAQPLGQRFITFIAAGVAVAMLFWRMIPLLLSPEVKAGASTVGEQHGTVETIGRLLFSDLLFPFEALSILLLVAIVGAVIVNRRNRPQGEGERSAS